SVAGPGPGILTAGKESRINGKARSTRSCAGWSWHAYVKSAGWFLKEGVMYFSKEPVVHSVQKCVLWIALALVVISPRLMRAQSGQTVTVDQATMQAMLERIDQLEHGVQQLEAAQHTAPPQTAKVKARQPLSVDPPAQGPSPQAAQEHEPET